MKHATLWKLTTIAFVATSGIFAYFWLRPQPKSRLRDFVTSHCNDVARDLAQVQSELRSPSFDPRSPPMTRLGLLQQSTSMHLHMEIGFCELVHAEAKSANDDEVAVNVAITDLDEVLVAIQVYRKDDPASRKKVADELGSVMQIVEARNQRSLVE
jgi:hypothetical protein